ncbi:MAG: HAD family hydrolase [Thomasclavelia sp.]|jgi:Cof subfamily protein (haloacid dehalogenase superfamily)|nr:HAD family hydrolase [Thomasclavelia sp.]
MKYIFFDIDGTLTGASRKVTPKTIEAIKRVREKGNKVFLCTGRAPVSILKSLRNIGFDGIIASAGSYIQIGDKYIYENAIDERTLQEIIVLFTNANVLFTLESKEVLYRTPGVMEFFDKRHQRDAKDNPELARFLEARKKEETSKPISQFDITKDKIAKVCFIGKDKYALLDTVPYLSKKFNVVTFSQYNDDFINGEIIQKSCTKADAVKRVLDYYGASKKDSIGFGDSMNDYQMIEAVHLGIVSNKAPDKLKAIASDTFEDPDLDGIAKALDKLNF